MSISSLHYVEPLQLSDTFNEWFLRSNDMIDVVNNINVYDVDNGWGLARYRAVDGTTTLRVNIGVNEFFDGTTPVAASDYTYGLRFITDSSITGANNPDVSTDRRILTLDFENLPDATGGISGAWIHEDDYYAFSDTSTGTGAIRHIPAKDLLPYGVCGDHRFYGNIYFDGETTVINSSELYVDDVNLFLAASNTTDGSGAYLNDQNLDGAGIIIKGASGDKEFTYDYIVTSGGLKFNSFKSNIDLMLSSDSRFLSENKSFDLFSVVDDDMDLTFRQLDNESKIWTIRKNTESGSAVDVQGRLVFFYENTISGITKEALSLSKKGTVQISELDGDIVVGGVTYGSSFHHQPAQYGIPTTGMSGDKYLDHKWTNRKIIQHTAHGFTSGDVVRFIPEGTTYGKSYNDNKVSAEVIGIVEDTPGLTIEGSWVAPEDQYVIVYDGIVDLSGMSGGAPFDGAGMTAGEVYFLDSSTNSGGFTSAEPITEDTIRKTVLVAINSTEALFVNYLGTVVPATGGVAGGTGEDMMYDTATGYMTDPGAIPNLSFRNRVINGDFHWWQRAEDGLVMGYPHGAQYWDGTTGTHFEFSGGNTGYHADMWMINSGSSNWGGNSSTVHVYKMRHDADTDVSETYVPNPQTYLRFDKYGVAGATAWLIHRIEDVRSLSNSTSTSYATLSYWAKTSILGGENADVNVTLWQVTDGSVDGGTYNGGASACYGWVGDGSTTDHGFTLTSLSNSENFTKHTHTFEIWPVDELNTVSETIPISVNNNTAKRHWLELRWAIPGSWSAGVTAGIDISRVQLEAGKVATDWEYRHPSVEESMVKRYYQRIFASDVGGGLATGTTSSYCFEINTEPYPYSGMTPITIQLTSKCVNAIEVIANGWGTGALPINITNGASTSDIIMWTSAGRVDRSISSAGQYFWKSIYHMDTSIH